MASAKSEAMRYLGDEDDYINLAGLNREREIANNAYNTNMTSFQNAYNDLLNTIASNRNKARTDFGSGRATVNENAFLRNRESASDLASRGLRGGIAQLNKIGNRMETGRQYSNLANTFYNTMNEIDATERTGTNEYNTNVANAKNSLEAALADIGAREADARNAYRAQVAQLAEQIQARRAAASMRYGYGGSSGSGSEDTSGLNLENLGWDDAVNALIGSGIVGNKADAENWLMANTSIRPVSTRPTTTSRSSVRLGPSNFLSSVGAGAGILGNNWLSSYFNWR